MVVCMEIDGAVSGWWSGRMEQVSQQWQDFLEWYYVEASKPHRPRCLPMAVRGWCAATTLEERTGADEALLHWLCRWEWPEMSEAVL